MLATNSTIIMNIVLVIRIMLVMSIMVAIVHIFVIYLGAIHRNSKGKRWSKINITEIETMICLIEVIPTTVLGKTIIVSSILIS